MSEGIQDRYEELKTNKVCKIKFPENKNIAAELFPTHYFKELDEIEVEDIPAFSEKEDQTALI